MKLLLRYISAKNRWRIFLCLLLMLGGVALEMKAPEYSQQITKAISDGSATMEMVQSNGWIIFRLDLASTLLNILSGLLFSKISASYGADLRAAVYKRVLHLESESVSRLTVGSLITRTNNDVAVMQLLLLTLIQSGIMAPVTAVWGLLKIRTTNKAWVGASEICVAVLCVLIFTVTVLVYPKIKQLRLHEDDFNTVTRQGMEGIRVLRAFRADSFQKKRTDQVNGALARISFSTNRMINLLSPLVTLCRNALSISIYWIGALMMSRVSSSGRSVIMGNMTAFSQYSLQIISAFTSLISVFILLPEAMISVRRIGELFHEKSKVTYPKMESVAERSYGSVKLRDVSFTYDGAVAPCLHDMNLSIAPGEKIAITGSTGCGKTTFLYLLRRLMDGQQGEIILDGNNIRHYTEEQLGHIISMVPQKDNLFSGDVRFNICYGAEYRPMRMKKALRAAQVDFLGPEGIKTAISQNGTNLSGGQRQRLCLARALYRSADIYLLDDAFSALDTLTEQQIQKNLRRYYKNSTVVMVAQRVSTLRAADRIVVLEKGEILDVGTHTQLMRRCPFYYQLISSQAGKEVLS